MTGMLRWTEEMLDQHKRRIAGTPGVTVRTNRIQDEPDVPPAAPGAPGPQKPKIGRPKLGTRLESQLEVMVAQQLTLLKLPMPQREYKHIPNRNFRLDFAWPDVKVGIEVQGMVHRIEGRFKGDIEKRALGLINGWRILEVDRAAIKSGMAISWIETLLR